MDQELYKYPVDGVLDLHMFQPHEVGSVLEEYLFQCRKAGILRIRIIHGKGTGVQRRFVHTYLESCSFVREFQTANDASGWGATIAILNPAEGNEK